jgi:hypothetical protein
MKNKRLELSDAKRDEILQRLSDDLLMPTGDLGAALFAALLLAILLWKNFAAA